MSEFTVRAACPPTEYSTQFIQGMVDRMAVSFHKYGAVRKAYPFHVDALKSLDDRLRLYAETGNTEYLMDAANFAMIEFMAPAREGAHFKATDSDGSPGRRTASGRRTAETNAEVADL